MQSRSSHRCLCPSFNRLGPWRAKQWVCMVTHSGPSMTVEVSFPSVSWRKLQQQTPARQFRPIKRQCSSEINDDEMTNVCVFWQLPSSPGTGSNGTGPQSGSGFWAGYSKHTFVSLVINVSILMCDFWWWLKLKVSDSRSAATCASPDVKNKRSPVGDEITNDK